MHLPPEYEIGTYNVQECCIFEQATSILSPISTDMIFI